MIIFNTNCVQFTKMTKMTKKIDCVILLCASIFLLNHNVQAQTNPSNTHSSVAKIAVIVNNQAISTLDITQRTDILKQQLAQTDKTPPSDIELKTAVVERLIYESLMLQTAQAQNLIPSRSVVDQAIINNATQAGLSKDEFLKQVTESGMSIEQYTEELKKDIAIGVVREKNVVQRLKISEPEIDRFLSSPESGIDVEYTPLALFVAKPDNISAESTQLNLIKKQVDTLYQAALKAQKNADFLALQPSLPTNNTHNTELSTGTLDKFPNLFVQVLKTMNVGDTSDILESPAGFFILRLKNKRTVLPKVAQTSVRHILITVPNFKAETTVRNTITDIHNKLTLNPDLFADFAKTMSEDSSALKGGDLGWVFPRDLVPEFERVMDSLKPGEIAFPLRSQFGWHIIQVLDRKTVEIPLVRLRNQARNILSEQKQQQALTEWLEQLKAQAYIEYKITDVESKFIQNNTVNSTISQSQ